VKRLLIFAMSLPLILHSVPAQAATVTATGTNPSICNQTVGDSFNVVAKRLSDGDCVVEFKNVGTTTWTAPANISSTWVLVVAGGGGGGGDEGGGGGGGGYLENSSFAITGGSSISISVGDGGIAGTDDSAPGGNGGDSIFSTLTAKGGGGGGTAANSVVANRNGRSGGSGGGGAGENVSITTGGAASPAGQGFAGGGGKRLTGYGGGGASEAGESTAAGYGGDGKASSITGTSVTRAGGGGGGGGNNVAQSQNNGGAGGGGKGGGNVSGQVGVAGTDFLGGGGGGGGSGGGALAGYSGGSGIVIIRYTPITNQTITLSSLGTSSKTYPYSQVLSMSTTGSSGSGAITYAIAAGGSATSCALSNSSATATITASTSGTCLVAATIASDTYYNSATSSALTFTFNKASQSALSISSTSGSFGTPLTLATSGGNGDGLVSYVYAAGTTTCTLSSGVLTPAAAGTCLVTATKATDDNYSAISSSQTTITFTTGSTTATITIAEGTLIYRQAKLISASASVAGRVTFRVNNKILPGCKNKSTTGSAPNIIATCSYRPSTRGFVTITVTLNPTDSSYTGTVSTSDTLFVNRRSGARRG
jgi:hypothetical protein